jgi:UDP-glucose 4-epimerase
MGYIGSHTTVELIKAGHDVYIVDNLTNSSPDVLDAIEAVTNVRPTFLQADIQDYPKISALLKKQKIDAIIHFAAYKSVGESVTDPLKYYDNNVSGFIPLLRAAIAFGITNIVFSSSAAVYGNTPPGIISEDTPCKPESPYGSSKWIDEIILADTCTAVPTLSGTALRYFNVVGAHDSGLLGESAKVEAESLLPLIVAATAGKRPAITVFGTDYSTPDGTCLRDYVHVVDLAKAHIAAVERNASDTETHGYDVFNVGTGKPTSVLELIQTFEKVNDVSVPHKLGQRRQGDIVVSYASCDKAEEALHWRAEKTVEDAVRDVWVWQKHLDSMKNESVAQ